MERFIVTVPEPRLQDELWRAIEGRGAFRRFKDVLLSYPSERERWFSFSDRCIHDRMVDWLRFEGIEPANPIEPPDVPEPETQELAPDEAVVEDLTLLLIYLTSWEEQVIPERTVRRAWKGYLFEVLDALAEKGLIEQSRRAKSLYLTDEGLRRAQELAQDYARR
jgi:hypothetical protein